MRGRVERSGAFPASSGMALARQRVIDLLTTFTTSGLVGLWNEDLRHLRAFDADR
ncbi:MAG: hypothetical protein ACRDZU_08470 [Acidimicrobiales bacterium]